MADITAKFYRINGKVIDTSGNGLPGLKVEAWDKDLVFNDLLGSAVTDAAGEFKMLFDASTFAELFLDKEPDLFFKIYREGVQVHSTENSVLWNVRSGARTIPDIVLGEMQQAQTAQVLTQARGRTYRIHGQVIDRKTQQGVAGLKVETWDKDLIFHDLVGSAVTDQHGSFSIEFDNSYFSELFLDRQPDLFFRVYRGQGMLANTRNNVLWNVQRGDTPVTVYVDLPAGISPDDLSLVVHGRVRLADGAPFSAGFARAYDKDLRHEQPLGSSSDQAGQPLDADGAYRIPYQREQFRQAEKKNADLLVKIFTSADTDGLNPLVASKVVFNAAADQEINLVIPENASQLGSEYERLAAELAPLLEDVLPADLTDDGENADTLFLSGETGIPRLRIQFYAAAARLEARTGVRAEFFYGMARQGLPIDLERLFAIPTDQQKEALNRSFYGNIISAQLFSAVDEAIDRLTLLALEYALDQHDQPTGGSLRELLTAARIPAEQQLVFTRLSQQRSTPGLIVDEQFWQTLGEQAEFLPDGAGKLRFSLQLGELAKNHAPLVQALSADARIHSLRDLAALNAQDWQDIAGQSGVPAGLYPPGETQAEIHYAQMLYEQVRAAFPAATAAHHLKEHPVFTSLPAAAVLASFAAGDTEFDLGTVQIETYLTRKNHSLPADQIEDLKGLQRLFKLTGQADEMARLWDNRLHSAQDILRLGRDGFKRVFTPVREPDTSRADTIYEQAEQAAAAALLVYTRFSPAFNGIDTTATSTQRPIDLPVWAGLFGSAVGCDCEDCRSVFSPAAYLVDLLAFLKTYFDNQRQTALEVLLRRRPDLGTLELSCANTNTPLPQIDLVNELLEGLIARFQPFTLPGSFGGWLDRETAADGLLDIFQQKQFHLGPDCQVTVIEAATRWVLSDHSLRFEIERDPNSGDLTVSGVSFQTGWSEEELNANAEHLNPDAYRNLVGAAYPFSLPFNLPLEQAREYLALSGIKRHELMPAFPFAIPFNTPAVHNRAALEAAELNHAAIACEYLGMTQLEWELISGTSPDPANPGARHEAWTLWGLDQFNNQIVSPSDRGLNLIGDWIAVLSRADVLLQRAGLQPGELALCLQMESVNPGGRLRFSPLDECDPARMLLVPHDDSLSAFASQEMLAETFARLARFVRVWRRLGWEMPELDRAIFTLSAGSFEHELLLRLAHVQRLRAELKLPVTELLAYWGSIDTWRYRPIAGSEWSSLYERLFLNKAVLSQPDPAFSDPTNLTGALADHSASLCAALGLQAEDLSTLLSEPGLILNPQLNLANLSVLLRHASLARALHLAIPEFLALKALTGIDPFSLNNSANTLVLAHSLAHIRASAFSLGELDYLLRGQGAAPSESSLRAVLDDLRRELRAINLANSASLSMADPTGELTRKKLTWLKWDNNRIAETLATLGGSVTYEEALPLPAGHVFADELNNKASYDAARGVLRFSGPMSLAERTALKANLANPATDPLVDRMFNAPRIFVLQKMWAYEPYLSASLRALPAGVTIPSGLNDRLTYDAAAKELRLGGPINEPEKAMLRNLSTDADFQSAVTSLFDLLADPANLFMHSPDAAKLFDQAPGSDPQSGSANFRFSYVLEKLALHLRFKQGRELAAVKLGEALGLESASMQVLLTTCKSPLDPQPLPQQRAALLAEFLDERYINSDTAVRLNEADFPAQFGALRWLEKAARLVSKLKFSSEELSWIIPGGWFDFSAVPLTPTALGRELFNGWTRLQDLAALRDAHPSMGETLHFMFARPRSPLSPAPAREVLEKIGRALGWDAREFDIICNEPGFDLIALDDFDLGRLKRCFDLAKQLGASLREVARWVGHEVPAEQAQAIKQAARSRLTPAEWARAAAPVSASLREKQRAALVAYLCASPEASTFGWTQPVDIYDDLLIDPEMSAAMRTSRIKQAVNTVQLFIQRCSLGLEKDLPLPEQPAREWGWMRNYQLWEANRRVFVYPENWIEPELRSDKTPFFKELENELNQNELNAETAENAISNYLEKLDSVSHLQVVGMYQEIDQAAGINILHVVARTRSIPNIYYYRQWNNNSTWSAWQKIEMQIEGDQVLPIAFNRRLYLFWPAYFDKQKVEMPNLLKAASDFIMAYMNRTLGIGKAALGAVQGIFDAVQGVGSSFSNIGSAPPLSLTMPEFNVNAPRFSVNSPAVHWNNGHPSVDNPSVNIDSQPLVSVARQPSIQLSSEMQSALDSITTGLSGAAGAAGKGIQGLVDTESKYFSDLVQITTNFLPDKGSQIQMAWTEFKNKKWAPRKLSQQVVTVHDLGGLLLHKKRNFAFKGVSGANLHIHCYYLIPQLPAITLPRKIEVGIPIELRMFGEFRLARDRSLDAKSIGPTPDQLLPDLLADVLDIGLNETRRFVEGEPVSAEDSEASGFRQNVVRKKVNPRRDFRLITPHQYLGHLERMPLPPPFFFQDNTNMISEADEQEGRDDARIFLVWSGGGNAPDRYSWSGGPDHSWFMNFYHPFAPDFMHILDQGGPMALLQRSTQLLRNDDRWFDRDYSPVMVNQPHPTEEVDFETHGAYSQYNWELFFHAPLLIANRMSKNQRFAEAHAWFSTIFDPLDSSVEPAPRKYWRTRPFFETTSEEYHNQDIRRMAELLASDQYTPGRQALFDQVAEWRSNPFEPHRIAALRTSSYQKTVVMKYLDNLIAWGDTLLHRDTLESINEAAQLYMMAERILGKRPQPMLAQRKAPAASFNQLQAKLDVFSNSLVQFENLLPAPGARTSQPGLDTIDVDTIIQRMRDPSWRTIGISPSLQDAASPQPYFSIPQNDRLLAYWDTIADRLFKVRHNMNLDGAVRQRPLWDAAIDPALIGQALDQGLDLVTILNVPGIPLPYYRFTFMAQKASELAGEVKALGAALLSALEKRDAEALARLRSGLELQVLDAVRQVKYHQVQEALESVHALENTRHLAEIRRNYYLENCKSFANEGEKLHLGLVSAAAELEFAAQGSQLAAAVLHMVPTFSVALQGNVNFLEIGGSGMGQLEYGGVMLSGAAEAIGRGLSMAASATSSMANVTAIFNNYHRRAEEWKLQADLSETEILQIDRQLAAATIRVQITESDLNNHEKQIRNAGELDSYMRTKFTNQELYDWMAAQISQVYFQSYQLAHAFARRTERTYCYELGLDGAEFIRYGYWDELKKGLLSGERLHTDLKSMEVAYMEQNKREYEITRHISLQGLDPLALITLKKSGRCIIDLPEALFDLDYPGHYMRRIKTVSLTIPCVSGPYSGVSCTLTMLKSSVRVNTDLDGSSPSYARKLERGAPALDERFRDNNTAIQSIATSSGQNDSGLFETSLRDERYLPFEGAGVICQWLLELPTSYSAFDHNSISDVVMHLRYTARNGGAQLKQAANDELQQALNQLVTASGAGLAQSFSLRHDFPTEWHRFQTNANNDLAQVFAITKNRFPSLFQDRKLKITIKQIDLLGAPMPGTPESSLSLPNLTLPGGTPTTQQDAGQIQGLRHTIIGGQSLSLVDDPSTSGWKLTAATASDLAHLQDILVVCSYKVEELH